MRHRRRTHGFPRPRGCPGGASGPIGPAATYLRARQPPKRSRRRAAPTPKTSVTKISICYFRPQSGLLGRAGAGAEGSGALTARTLRARMARPLRLCQNQRLSVPQNHQPDPARRPQCTSTRHQPSAQYRGGVSTAQSRARCRLGRKSRCLWPVPHRAQASDVRCKSISSTQKMGRRGRLALLVSLVVERWLPCEAFEVTFE